MAQGGSNTQNSRLRFRSLPRRHRGHRLVAKTKPSTAACSPLETISPEKLTVGHSALSELKFTDMSFVFTDAN